MSADYMGDNWLSFPIDPSQHRIALQLLNFGEALVIAVYDVDESVEHPVYLFSFSRPGFEMINGIMNYPVGTGMCFPGASWADYQCYIDTGNLPLGFDV